MNFDKSLLARLLLHLVSWEKWNCYKGLIIKSVKRKQHLQADIQENRTTFLLPRIPAYFLCCENVTLVPKPSLAGASAWDLVPWRGEMVRISLWCLLWSKVKQCGVRCASEGEMFWSDGGSSSQCPTEEQWGPDLLLRAVAWPQLWLYFTSLPFLFRPPDFPLEKGGVIRLRSTSLYICLLLDYVHIKSCQARELQKGLMLHPVDAP